MQRVNINRVSLALCNVFKWGKPLDHDSSFEMNSGRAMALTMYTKKQSRMTARNSITTFTCTEGYHLTHLPHSHHPHSHHYHPHTHSSLITLHSHITPYSPSLTLIHHSLSHTSFHYPHSLSHPLSLTLTLTLIFTPSRSPPFTHSHTPSHSHSLTPLTHDHSLPLTHSLSHLTPLLHMTHS